MALGGNGNAERLRSEIYHVPSGPQNASLSLGACKAGTEEQDGTTKQKAKAEQLSGFERGALFDHAFLDPQMKFSRRVQTTWMRFPIWYATCQCGSARSMSAVANRPSLFAGVVPGSLAWDGASPAISKLHGGAMPGSVADAGGRICSFGEICEIGMAA